ncbi:MAG: site-specific integrase [Actinomycetota bacterium]|nr:site-specific integrase [Actinomycetota bacterium]
MKASTTYQVRFWKLKHVKGRRRPWGVRWVTGGREHSEWYSTKALAESFRADLVRSARAGEAFDTRSGLPLSVVRQRSARTLFELATAFVDWTWPRSPGNTRKGIVTSLAAVVPLFVRQLDHAPPAAELQRLLSSRILPLSRRDESLTAEEQATISWLRRASRPISELQDELTASELLDGLSKTVDGRQVTYSTWDKRRAVLHQAVSFAVSSGWLDANPISGRRLGSAPVIASVDPRSVLNPAQGRQLLAAVTYVGARRRHERERGRRLYAFFACLYYGGLRPGEVQRLQLDDCVLPTEGWGELLLAGSWSAVSGAHFAVTGTGHEVRPLKRRRAGDVRRVPIPPVLVGILRAHVTEFGTAPDGRLFPAVKTGRAVPASVYTRVWVQARQLGLSPAQYASPLARRPYDLRHAALSGWLNAGVPPADVAARAGHSVKVLLTIYAKCLDGQTATFNARIDELLGE